VILKLTTCLGAIVRVHRCSKDSGSGGQIRDREVQSWEKRDADAGWEGNKKKVMLV
jgi:hypothetical protein